MVTNRKQTRQQLRFDQRQEKKRMANHEKVEAEVAMKIKKLLRSVLSLGELDEMAKNTGFITRKRELPSIAILSVLMMGCANSQNISSLETMCSYLHKWFNIWIKPQSLQARINRKETSLFMKKIMLKVMEHEANKVIDKLLKKQNSNYYFYKRILLQDSTVISLPETVARIFRGCGGSASKAAVKCDVIIDQINHLIVRIRCVAGRIPDSSLSGDIIEYLEKDDLVIRDLGYFNLDNFTTMVKKNINFISRLSKSVHVYLTKDEETHLDLIKHLEKLGISNKKIDIEVYIGKKARIPMRLIGLKVPPEIIELRKQRHKQIRKTEPSEELTEWNGYTLMLTNIPKNKLNLKQILELYRTRWQIELFFKNIKSYLHIDELTGKNKYRITTLIYTKLILTWMASLLYAYAQIRVGKDREVSKFKFTRWLQIEADWKKVFINLDLSKLLKELDQDLSFLCKQKGRKPKSWENANEKNMEIAA